MFLLPKTIAGKVTLLVIIILALNITASTFLFTQSNYGTAILSMENTLPILTVEVAEKTALQIESIAVLARALAADGRARDTSLPLKTRADFLKGAVDSGNFLMIGITDAEGNVANTSGGTNPVSERDYFKITKATGKSTTSDLLESKTTGQKSIYTTAPIIVNDKFEGIIYIGTLYENISKLINSVDFGKSGFAMIVDKNGRLLAHKNNSLVAQNYNIKDSSRTNPIFAKIVDDMTEGKIGSGFYTDEGIERYITYTPVAGTSWALALTVDTSDFLTNYYAERKSYIIATSVIIIFSIIFSIVATGIMVRPLKKVTNDMITLVKEEARRDFVEFKNKDEMRLLADAMHIRENVIQSYVAETASVLKALSSGDLTKTVTSEFGGSYAPVKDALNNTVYELSNIINMINANSIDLSRISGDFLQVFNVLAQSATSQAAAVSQLSSAISSMSEQIAQNSENSKTANDLSVTMMKTAADGNENMSKMLASMQDIESSSSEINKIVSVIDDIANQTNLLALNAAIEAARAGDSGRGFAVVADEVRKLAEKSSNATAQIRELINKSVNNIQIGAQMAEYMANSLDGIINSVESVSSLVTEISHTSEQEHLSAREIKTTVDQIAENTHSTSAAAEESSQSATALASQAEELKNMVDRFNIK